MTEDPPAGEAPEGDDPGQQDTSLEVAGTEAPPRLIDLSGDGEVADEAAASREIEEADESD